MSVNAEHAIPDDGETFFTLGSAVWKKCKALSWSFVRNLLLCGKIPSHVAFIMDGNRRWARVRNEETVRGHSSGFIALKRTLEWCLELGVQEVTVYAFSIENFRRPANEVDGLMKLAQTKVLEMLEKGDVLDRYRAGIRIIGNRDMIPRPVMKAFIDAENRTAGNIAAGGPVLNICFAYTSSDEVVHACTRKITSKAQTTVQDCLYTSQSPNPEVLIRTSGETRFSDFLTYQCSDTASSLYFVDVLWPDMHWRHLVWPILSYQLHSARN